MSEITPTATATPTPSAPESTVVDLDAMRAAKAKGETYDPTPAPAEDATPDPEVEADPDLAEEIDKIEAPKPEESPAEKAARTKRHKAAAAKSKTTRFYNERNEARRERDELKAEIERLRSTTATPLAAAPASEAQPSESAKAKPTLRDFPLENFREEDDPYAAQQAAIAEALIDWKREQQISADRESRQREQAERDEHAAAVAFNGKVEEARKRLPDFDAVVNAYSLPKSHPLSAPLFALVTRSDVGADIAYHLGKHRDALVSLMNSRDADALRVAFGRLEGSIESTLKGSKPAASHRIPAVAEYVQPVSATASSGAVLRNPMQDDGTELDLDAVRAYKRAGRR